MVRPIRPQETSTLSYAAVLDSLPIVAYMAAPDGTITYVSRGWSRFTGIDGDRVVKSGYHFVIHPDDLAHVVAVWDGARASGVSYRDEFRLLFGDGSYRWVSSQAEPVRGDGSILGWFGTVTDIHTQRMTEEALGRALERSAQLGIEASSRLEIVERLMQASEDCIEVLDLDGRLVMMSSNGRKAMGIEADARIEGRVWLASWHGEDRERAETAVRAAREGGHGRFTGMYPVRGNEKWWDVTVSPIVGADGRLEQLLAVSRDVTERALAHRALERSEERYRVLGEALPGVTWTATPTGAVDHVTGATASKRAPEAEMLGDAWLHSVHPEERPAVRARWRASVESGEPYEAQFRVLMRDGTYRWHLVRALPQREGGEIVRWVGVNVDVDHQQRAYERERRIAVTFQEASLPLRLPQVPGLRFSAEYRPGQSEATIGGDWYDAFVLDDGRIAVTLGDVLGSGLGAAVKMGKVRQAMRAVAYVVREPGAMLAAADRVIRAESADTYATALAGIFDPATHEFAFASAGHPAPVVRRPGGEIEELSASGVLLGMRSKTQVDVVTIRTEVGASLVFYTDGLVEATRDIEEGIRRTMRAIADDAVRAATNPAYALVEHVLGGEPATDDTAVLVIDVLE